MSGSNPRLIMWGVPTVDWCTMGDHMTDVVRRLHDTLAREPRSAHLTMIHGGIVTTAKLASAMVGTDVDVLIMRALPQHDPFELARNVEARPWPPTVIGNCTAEQLVASICSPEPSLHVS